MPNIGLNHVHQGFAPILHLFWVQGWDLNPWHLAYEANNLPDWYTLWYIIHKHGVCSFNHTHLCKISRTFYGVVSPVFLRTSSIFFTTFNACLPMNYTSVLVVPMRLELMTSRLKVESSKSNWAKEPGCSFFTWQAEYRPALRMFFANWESRMTCRNDKFSNYTGHQEIPHRNLPT